MIKSKLLAGVLSGIMAAAAASAMTASAAEFKLGDPTGDGMIDSIDASYILSLYADLSVNKGEIADEIFAICDVDKDGKVNSLDASLILSYYADQSIGDIEITLEKFIENLENKVTSWWDENAKDLDLSAFDPDSEWSSSWWNMGTDQNPWMYPWSWSGYEGVGLNPVNIDGEDSIPATWISDDAWDQWYQWYQWGSWENSPWSKENPYQLSLVDDTDELRQAWQDYSDLLGEVDAESTAIAEGTETQSAEK